LRRALEWPASGAGRVIAAFGSAGLRPGKRRIWRKSQQLADLTC
jgi:hypothetical protein